MDVVAANELRKRFGQHEVVRGIDLAVPAVHCLGLLGPNGAGKTTTLKMLSGLLFPTAGQAHVLGYVPWKRENARRSPSRSRTKTSWVRSSTTSWAWPASRPGLRSASV